jgi:outer membrane protein TolC
VAKAGYYPQVTVFANYGVERSLYSENIGDRDAGWAAGVRGSWDIFSGFRTKGQVSEARASLDELRAARRRVELAVDVEVKEAILGVAEAEELVAASAKVVEQGEESVRRARARLDAGAGIQLDVLSSQLDLVEALLNRIQANYDLSIARLRVAKARGTMASGCDSCELTKGVEDRFVPLKGE